MSQKVLVIDDSPTVQGIIRASLCDEPVELLLASTGTEGINLAHSALPDLILLDVEMPAPDGFEVCRQLKSSAATAHIPIVFITSMSLTATKVEGFDLGAVDYITKPFEGSELRARVRTLLRNKYAVDLLAAKTRTDALTGVGNRAMLDQQLIREFAAVKRHGGTLSVIMTDVDRFKALNDTYGHAFGDEVLRQVAQLLVSSCRCEDIVCRYGGEEFVILAPRIPIGGAMIIAERARCAIGKAVFPHHGAEVSVSCSFGVAELQTGVEGSPLEAADAALYRAKQSGRNCVVAAPASPVDSIRKESRVLPMAS